MKHAFIAKPNLRLRDVAPDHCAGLDKEKTKIKTLEFCQRIGELQPKLYANGTQGIVIVLQGIDTSGKDGTSRRVLEFVNPSGVEFTAFKVPSAEEKAHDFLWRVHKALPRHGNIGVWNRSHYEEVLVVRVLNLAPKEVWQKRYDQINAFEKILTGNGYQILKFFLHISKKEQAARLQDRLDDPAQQWKFAAADVEMRKRWDDFQQAYEDMLNRCSTRHAPWYVVPADRNWYRDYIVSSTVCNALESLDLKWPKPSADFSRIRF